MLSKVKDFFHYLIADEDVNFRCLTVEITVMCMGDIVISYGSCQRLIIVWQSKYTKNFVKIVMRSVDKRSLSFLKLV